MSNFFNSPILTLLQSGPKTPEQQVQYATSPLQQSLNGGQRVSLPDFTQQPIQIKPIIPARDATGTVQSVRHNTHTDQVPTNVDERLKRNRQILGDVVETAIDFTPVIGDIKGLTWDPIKAGIEGGFGAGLSMAGLGLIGLAPGVGDVAKKAGKVTLKSVDDIPFIFRNNYLKEIRELSDATSNISRQIYIKPWKYDPSKSNQAIAYRLKNKPDQYFELVQDTEPGYYSVHFKTDRGALTEDEKTELIKAIYNDLPDGAKISTWGTVSGGRFSGIDRFRTQMGMIPTSEMRTVGIKKGTDLNRVLSKYPSFVQNIDGSVSMPILQKNPTFLDSELMFKK